MPISFVNTGATPFSQELQVLNPSPGFWGSLPNIQNVVYTSVDDDNAGNTDHRLPFLITSPRKREEGAPSYGVYRKWKTTFKIDPAVWLAATADASPAIYPKMRDQITVDGKIWTVFKDVDAPADMLPRGLWRLCCIRLEIVIALEYTVQYQQSSCAGSSSTGSRTVSFTNIGSPVAAAIQPMTASLGDQFGTKNFGDNFVMYLQSDPSGTGYTIIQAGDLFVDQDSVKYEIQEVHDRDRIDALPAFICVKKL